MNELRAADENSKRASADAARLAEELRREQEHSGQIEKLRRGLEAQVSTANVMTGARLSCIQGILVDDSTEIIEEERGESELFECCMQ